MRLCGACVGPGMRTRQLVECRPQMARRVVLGGGVPLVRPQEELRGPNGYTARGLVRAQGRRQSADFWVL